MRQGIETKMGNILCVCMSRRTLDGQRNANGREIFFIEQLNRRDKHKADTTHKRRHGANGLEMKGNLAK